MATAESVKAKVQGLIDAANATTGAQDTDLTSAVGTLCAGFGSGGGGMGAVKCVDADITVEASATTAVTYIIADQELKSSIENQTKWSVFNGDEIYLYQIMPVEYTGEATGNTTRVYKNTVGLFCCHTNYIVKTGNFLSFGKSGSMQSNLIYGIYFDSAIAAKSATDGVGKFDLSVSVRHDSSGNYEVIPGVYNLKIWYLTDVALVVD